MVQIMVKSNKCVNSLLDNANASPKICIPAECRVTLKIRITRIALTNRIA